MQRAVHRSPNAIVFGLLFALALMQLALEAPGLPEQVASHFDSSGQPDGFMGKTAFVTLMACVHVALAVTMGGAALWLPHLGDDYINLRNKAYWLAPERRAASLRVVSVALLDMGSLTFALLLWVTHAVVAFNLGEADRLDGFWWVLGLYLGITFVWVIRLHRRFGPPPRTAA